MDNLFKSDPLRWWKRYADSYLDSSDSTGTLWGYWRLEEFQEFVRLRPLSPEDVNYFLNFRVGNLKLSNEMNKFTICRAGKSPVLFDITLGLPESERGIALVHEVVHGFYRYRGNPYGGALRCNPEERAVEAVAKRFFRKNNQLIENIIMRIV